MMNYPLIFSSVLTVVLACSSAVADGMPNILWIITDDHRADSIQAYNRATSGRNYSPLGYVMSPEADKLAKEGVLFTRAYCNSPGCAPSRTSMHFGMYPHRNGHYGFEQSHQATDVSKPVLPELMRDRGYSTALFGKSGYYVFKFGPKKYQSAGFYDQEVSLKDLMTHGHTDWAKAGKWVKGKSVGFEFTWNFEDGPIRYLIPKDGKLSPENLALQQQAEEKMDAMYAYARDTPGLVIGGVSPTRTAKTMDGEIASAFRDYLANAGKSYSTPWNEQKQGPSPDRPIFVNLGFHFPHTPVLPSKEFRDLFIQKEREIPYKVPAFDRDTVKKLPPQMQTWFKKTNFADMKLEDQKQSIRDYYAFCAMGDSLIGDSVRAFKDYSRKSGRDWLILYVIGDHGWHLGEQGGTSKFAPYDTSNHCAVIAVSSDKKKWPAGKVSHELVEFVDFAPTILRESGADLNEPAYAHLDGRSMDDIYTGAFKRDYVIGEMNHVMGPRAYLRSDDFAFSMRVREKSGKPGDKWGHPPGEGIMWGLEAPREDVELMLFDLRNDAGEAVNVANDAKYLKLADWFRNKLGRIVLGDRRLEADWNQENSYVVTDFALGAHDHRLEIPAELIPAL